MSLISWFYGVDAEVARGKELDAQLRDFNQRKVESGQWTQEQADESNARLALEDPNTYTKSVDDAFDSGLQEGWQNVTGKIKSGLAAPFRFAWDSIPWQVWAVGIGFLIYWTGAWRQIAKAIK